jgi:hypothetical protein
MIGSICPGFPCFVHPFHGLFMGAGTAGERGNSLSQLIVGMVAIGSADHVLGGP